MSKLCIFRGWRAILNIHERSMSISLETAGQILESLSSDRDLLWPNEKWPPMMLNRGLACGSLGGHAAIRYWVTEHLPGRRIGFEFHPMHHLHTFYGRHYFEIVPRCGQVIMRHTIDVKTDFATWIYWKLLVEHVHDAVIEDAFDKAERSAGLPHPHRSRWSLHVRFLRWLRARKDARQLRRGA